MQQFQNLSLTRHLFHPLNYFVFWCLIRLHAVLVYAKYQYCCCSTHVILYLLLIIDNWFLTRLQDRKTIIIAMTVAMTTDCFHIYFLFNVKAHWSYYFHFVVFSICHASRRKQLLLVAWIVQCNEHLYFITFKANCVQPRFPVNRVESLDINLNAFKV